MALIDKKLVFSEDQAITSVGTAGSTNIINFGSGYDGFWDAKIADYGKTGDLFLNVRVTTTFTAGATTATLKFTLQDSTTGATGSWRTVFDGRAITQPNLDAGVYLYRGPVPASMRQYVRVLYTAGTTAFTAGKVSSWLAGNAGDV